MEELTNSELATLTAVARLRGNAYGVSILDELVAREGRSTTYGAVHVALSRLEARNYLSSKMGEPTNERGGRRKKYFTLTADGEEALVQARKLYKERFRGLGWLKPVLSVFC